MKATNYNEAWTMAREIFPTAMQKDETASTNAGYSVYRSTDFNRYYCYICDLGDRLEINLDDGRTINIWIKPEEDEEQEIRKTINEIKAAKAAAEIIGSRRPTFAVTHKIYIEFAIGGETYDTEEERRIYNALKTLSTFNQSEVVWHMIDNYCKTHGINAGTMEAPHIHHYSHGSKATGHYIIGVYVTTHEELESRFN